MRKSMFGDFYVETTDDDLAEAFISAELEPADCYAMVSEAGEGDWMVEIFGSEDGDLIVATDDGLFQTAEAAVEWARSWVTDVQTNI